MQSLSLLASDGCPLTLNGDHLGTVQVILIPFRCFSNATYILIDTDSKTWSRIRENVS